MKNKKKIILGTTIISSLALAGGVLAFFTAEDTDNVQSKVGTVSVNVTADISHTQMKRDEWAMMEYQMNNMNDAAINVEAEPSTPEEVAAEREEMKEMFEEAPDNINPGDNDYIDWEYDMPRHGTDHEIVVNIENTGTKSIETRVLVQITNKSAATENSEILPLLRESINPIETIFVAFDPFNTISGISSLHTTGFDNILLELQKLELSDNDPRNNENTIVYGLNSSMVKYIVNNYIGYDAMMAMADEYPFADYPSDAITSGLIFSGIGENAEIEKYAVEVEIPSTEEDIEGQTVEPNTELKLMQCPTKGSFKLDLGMIADQYNDGNELQDAELEITVTVQAIQYRNTSDATWETVFEEVFYTTSG